MPLSTEMCGVLLMIASGIFVTGDMVASKLIENSGWPYWYLISGVCLVATGVNGAMLRALGVAWPKLEELKWVVSRSFLQSLQWHSMVLAVLVGASPGDVAALSSVDIIAAALLGLVFLGEKLSLLHFFALVISAVGAIFISKPEFIFGLEEGEHRSNLGSVLALFSGLLQAASFICARKSADVSVGILTFCNLLLGTAVSLLPPMLPMVHASWQPVMAEPGTAMLIVLLLVLLTTLSIVLPAAGSTRCPAAVSATVFTSSCMVSGYLSQVFFFQEIPSTLTILGAACMLLSVVLMALPSPEREAAPESKDTIQEEADETPSLGSFVASEVSFRTSPARRRVRTILAEQIGLPVTSG
ncbi:unnamed protein product [Durusdinium trenchii]|uniref:EamA domain-containing protein n=1 Tax=Durusdinium trenchii TaxID=1381693 RepID=A0ABP0NJL9_9DINO